MSSKLILEKVKWLLEIWDYNISVCLRFMLKCSFKRVIFISCKIVILKSIESEFGEWISKDMQGLKSLQAPQKLMLANVFGFLPPDQRRWSAYHGHWVGKKVGMNFHAPLYLRPPQPYLLCGQRDYLKKARYEMIKVSLFSQSRGLR